jgi:hypothetical protein
VGSDLITVRVEASEARFGAALELARKAGEISATDSGWILSQRFEITWHALEVAVLLDRAREVADVLVGRFLDPDPPPLDGHFARVPMRFPAICVRASVPDRCFARLRSLRRQLSGANTPETDAFTAGAEQYAKRDLLGAAKAWRQLLDGTKTLVSLLPDATVEAFDLAGAPDLVEEVDLEVMKRAYEFNGATLAHVRAARRALQRGDRERARQLAEQVIKAWSLADEEPSALADMRRLVKELQRPDARASPP